MTAQMMCAEFVPLPGADPAVRRVRADKAKLWSVLAELHQMHFSDSVIALVTGFSHTYVRTVLTDMGFKSRWSDAADVRAALPSTLLEALGELQIRNKIPSKP
jgi:hypothetical protein